VEGKQSRKPQGKTPKAATQHKTVNVKSRQLDNGVPTNPSFFFRHENIFQGRKSHQFFIWKKKHDTENHTIVLLTPRIHLAGSNGALL
jgi:hypothetical protein